MDVAVVFLRWERGDGVGITDAETEIVTYVCTCTNLHAFPHPGEGSQVCIDPVPTTAGTGAVEYESRWLPGTGST